MRQIAIGILAVILTGCGRGTVNSIPTSSEFSKYTQAFDAVSRKYGIEPVTGHISIRFRTLPATSEIGYCWGWTLTSGPEIGIDKVQWEQLADDEKKMLIFHELGHCILNEVHRPDSIMNPTLIPIGTFQANEDSYIDELFSHAR